MHCWSHAVLGFVKSQVATANLTEALRLRYRVLGLGALVKLIVKAMRILGQSEALQATTHFPNLIDLIFKHLTVKLRNILIEALVSELEDHSRLAFDCLDRLLET